MATDVTDVPGQTPPEGEPAPQAPVPTRRSPDRSSLDTGFDTLVDNYFDAEPAPADAPEQDGPTRGTTDTPAGQSDPGDDTGDTPEETGEGAEAGDEQELGDDLTDPTEEDEEIDALLAATPDEPPADTRKEESFLPEFDRANFLKEHPELEAPYKHMQAAFTKRMTDVSKREKQAETVRSKAETMEAQYNAFQEHLRNDETFEEFLVQVALNRPQVVERAFERVSTLQEDEGARKEYEREQKLKETESKLKQREEQDALVQRQRRTEEIVDITNRVAKRLGLTAPGDVSVAEEFVAKQILANHANKGVRDVTTEEIVASVRKAASLLKSRKDEAALQERRKLRQQELEEAQKRARNGNRPPPPRAGAPTGVQRTPQRIDNRPKKSALDAFIDEQLGVED